MKKKPKYLTVKDHSISGEEFQLIYNEEYDMLETFPKPSTDILPKYYQSEDYISHTDSKRNLFERVYHLIKIRSLQQKLKLINGFNTEAKTLLDIGCGTGDFLKVAQNNKWSVVGVEPNDTARTIAKGKTQKIVESISDVLENKEYRFDVITLWHVLEHLPNLNQDIQSIKSLLKPNGKVVIAVPNYKSYDAKHYKNFWAAYDAPRHLWHFSRESIFKLMVSNKLNVEKIKPMVFDSFYVSLLSEKYKSGFMNPVKAFFIGILSNLKAIGSKEYSSLIYIIKKDQNTI